MPSRRTTCPDCDCKLTDIQIVDKQGRKYGHAIMEYAVNEAQQSFWTGRFPIEVKVNASMCDQCGRVLLYASSKG